MSSALAVEALRSGYGETTVLRDISLRVEQSSIVALLGANGAGKTTLLKTISGLIPATAGTISIGGDDITRLSPHLRQQRGLCYIPEGRGIFRSLTVRENLSLQAKAGRERQAIERATDAIPALSSHLSQLAGTLSGGEQQMLAVAQAYIAEPPVLLVDEASLGLAPKIVDTIFDFLLSINQRGTAILLVDQFVARALNIASYVYLLRKGEIAYSGPAKSVMEGDILAQYFGSDVTG
jgi:branched-chain amino acid transport system ATP-binding protein